jgi:uncharacterized protein YndB with AHSA1/START domain
MAEPTLLTHDIVVKRIIDVPLETAWKAWTDPKSIMQWWGPQDFTSPTCKIDLRVGGRYVFSMLAPDYQGGQLSYSAGVFTKIVPLERLEFTQGLSDQDGNPIDPAQIGMPPDFPPEIYTSVVFKDKNGMTELTITEHDWPVSQMAVFSFAGMQQSIDKLAEVFGRL